MTQYCYLNGHFLATDRAHISVQDRGFRFGDGVFETIAVYSGMPYQWELHMERLKAGLSALTIPADTDQLRQPALQLISKNGLSDATLRIAISRGVGSIGYLPVGCACSTVVIEAFERLLPPPDPASLWLSSYEKPSPKALPVQFKLSQGLNSTLVRMEGASHGCQDGLLLNAAGHICETSSANIFWLKGETLYTPSLSCGVLNGTTRSAILRVSPYRVKEGAFSLDELQVADAIVMTNTAWQVMPVGSLKPTGWEWPGSTALAVQLRHALHQDVSAYVAAHHA